MKLIHTMLPAIAVWLNGLLVGAYFLETPSLGLVEASCASTFFLVISMIASALTSD